MTSLNTLLAINKDLLVKIGIGVGVAVLVLAFVVGIVKGFRKVGKGGLLWLLAGGGFAFLYSKVGEKNFLSGLLKGKALESYADAIWAFLLVVACIAAALAIAFALSILFRYIPSDETEEFTAKEVIDDEELNEDCEKKKPAKKEKTKRKRKRERKGGETSILVRISGGFVCLLNLASILGIAAIFALAVMSGGRYGHFVEPVLSNGIVKPIFDFAKKYIFDIVTVGIVMAVAYKGFKTGFARTLKNFLRRAGVLLVVIAGFVLPFLGFFDNISIVNKIVQKLIGILPSWGKVSNILARLILGAGLAVAGAIVMAILVTLLRKLTYAIEDTKIMRKIDGTLSAILYLVLGVAVCLAFWAVMVLLNRYKIVAINEMLTEPSFAKECVTVAKALYRLVASKLPFKLF